MIEYGVLHPGLIIFHPGMNFLGTISEGVLKNFAKFTGKHMCHLPQTCPKQDNFQVIEPQQNNTKTQICRKI